MVPYRGRNVDPISLWGTYVDFPPNWNPREDEEFSPLMQCPNPDHQTDKRHFQVNLKQATVHCFTYCGISGSYENAIAMIEGVTAREARKSILKHARLGKPSKVRHRIGGENNVPMLDNTYDRYLPPGAVEYLENRGIDSTTIAAHELGWDAVTERIVIPVKDVQGRVRFLIRRAVKPRVEPRYLYPEGSEKTRFLFGACDIDRGVVTSSGIVLVEGSIDRLVLYNHGMRNVVAILGSKVSEIQAQLIANMRPARVYTMFDADAAGVGATISAAKLLRSAQVRVCRYPKGKSDPAMLNEREAYRSIERSITFQNFRQLQTKRKEISVG